MIELSNFSERVLAQMLIDAALRDNQSETIAVAQALFEIQPISYLAGKPAGHVEQLIRVWEWVRPAYEDPNVAGERIGRPINEALGVVLTGRFMTVEDDTDNWRGVVNFLLKVLGKEIARNRGGLSLSAGETLDELSLAMMAELSDEEKELIWLFAEES